MEYGIWCLPVTDLRKEQLQRWLNEIKEPSYELIALNGDASLRRYFRYGSKIAVDAPPQSQKNLEFITIAKALKAQGIKVPNIYNYDLSEGFLLLEDLGSTLFSDVAVGDKEDFYYLKTIPVLMHLAKLDCKALPAFDKDFILFELSLFPEWMLNKTFNMTLSKGENSLLNDSFNKLALLCNEQEQIAMHRDFHSRNLMLTDNKLAVIDFQDMVKGPLCYDLASLLFDCYKVLPKDLIEKMTQEAFTGYKALGFIKNKTLDEFKTDLIAVSLQRHLKVLGIFCRLKLRDHKDGYIKDLPRVLNYALEESSYLPGFSDLYEFLNLKVKAKIHSLCQ